MRIGIDARLFGEKHFTGISRSAYECVKVWEEEFGQHEFFLFSREPMNIDMNLPANWHVVNEPWIINKGKLYVLFQMPKMIKELKLDVFWGTNFFLPKKVEGTRYYLTVYDMAVFRFKNVGARRNTLRLRTLLKHHCKKCSKIIAISEATANDIHDIFGFQREKIAVSYCGGLPSDFTRKEIDDTKVNPMLKFDEEFFLFISTIEPRKNIVTIVKGFEQFLEATGSDMKLVLAGKIGWKTEAILEAINESKYKDRIILPGYISDDDKEYLLSNAKSFVYPSLYEGFGIPILEGMEYGLPVITSNVSSMPEVGGDAAFYIQNVTDAAELAQVMQKVVALTEDEINELQEKMKIQCEKFSWRKNARELIQIFSEK